MDYLDFELEVGTGEGRNYPVAVLDSPAGEARATMHFRFDELTLENRLLELENALLRSGGQPRRTLSREGQEVQSFGHELFKMLFAPEVRSCFDISLTKATDQGKGLRLKLRIRPPELAALPWEYIWHPGQAEYVSLSTKTPIVRYLEVPQPIQPLAVAAPLRILGMIASPSDLSGLDAEREKRRVERALRDPTKDGKVELTWLAGQSWRDLLRAMRQGTWHIFHFIGHGGFDPSTGEGLIVLADRKGRAAHFSATRLGRLLADHDALRLVLLNSCEGARGSGHDIFSSTASILVRRGILAVLAMQYVITDQAAIEFARTFYESVGDEMPVDAAVAEARKAISFAVNNTVEWGAPVLYMRSPNGVLFDLAKTQRTRRPAPQRPEPSPAVEVDEEQATRLDRLYDDGLDAFWIEDWDRAVRSFQAIAEQRPDYEDAVARLRQAEQQRDLARLYAQAQAAQEAGDWPAAVPILEELVSRAPDFEDAAALLETAEEQVQLASLYAQAQRLQAAGHWQAVMNILAEINAREPDYPGSRALLAAADGALAEERRRTAAHDLYLHAGRAMEDERWEEARELLVQVRGMEAGYRETERLLARAEAEVAERRRQADLAERYHQAQAARAADDWSRAVSELEKLVAEAPEFERAAALLEELKTTVPAAGEARLFDGREMVYVPGGSFWMGSDEGEGEGYSDERPRHEVVLPGFWIDRTPVTNAEFGRFVEATCHQTTTEAEGQGHVWTGSDWKKVRRADWRHPIGRRSNIKDKADHPVVLVSWHDAVAYCQWRSEQAGAPIHLPTEAEWEKAARGIDGWRYPWGNEFDASKCNSAEEGTGDTTPVGHYSPDGDSPYGLVDMAGNVWEWTCSLYKPYPYRAQDGREDPRADGARVVRGGSWDYGRRNVRTASRNRYVPSFAHNLVGFRCACSTTRGEAEATPPQAGRRRKPMDLPEAIGPPGDTTGQAETPGPLPSSGEIGRPRPGRLPEESGPHDQ